MPLPPTPWLNPPDYMGSYLKGTALGSEAAQARNRLVAAQQQAQAEIAVARERIQQQAVEAQMEAMIRREAAEREARIQQSRIDIDAAYKEAMVGIQGQRLESAARLNDLKLREAANQAATRMRIDERVQGGEDYNKVIMEESASAGYNPSQVAAIQRIASVPQGLDRREQSAMRRQAVGAAYRDLQQMEKDLAVQKEGSKEQEALQKRIADTQRRIQTLSTAPEFAGPFPESKQGIHIARDPKTGRLSVVRPGTETGTEWPTMNQMGAPAFSGQGITPLTSDMFQPVEAPMPESLPASSMYMGQNPDYITNAPPSPMITEIPIMGEGEPIDEEDWMNQY